MQKQQLCVACKVFYASGDSPYCSQHGGDRNLSMQGRIKAAKIALASELCWGEKEFDVLITRVKESETRYEALNVIHVMCNNLMRQELDGVKNPMDNYRLRSNLKHDQVMDLLHAIHDLEEGDCLPNMICESIISRYFRGEEHLDAHPLDKDRRRTISRLDMTGGCILSEMLRVTRAQIAEMSLVQYREFLLNR